MRHRPLVRAAALLAALAVAPLACVRGARSPDLSPTATSATSAAANSPAALVARAIEQAGGRTALAAARALVWEGDAVVHAGGRTVPIAGRWAVQPPDTAVVSTWAVARGPATVRHLVVAAPRGWTVRDGQFTELPPTLLANERDAFYLYDVLRLVPLLAPGVTLAPAPADSAQRRGVRVTRPGRPTVDLYVDAAGRAALLRATVASAETGAPVREDVALDGTIEAAGVRWPRTLRITLDGAPYFDLTLRTLRVAERLDDTLVAGPR